MNKDFISIKILKEYYNIDVNINCLVCSNTSTYFFYNSELFLLKNISKNQHIFFFDNFFCNIIRNVNNDIITYYNGYSYVLSKKNKSMICIDIILLFNVINSQVQKSYYYYNLRNKFMSFEKYVNQRNLNLYLLNYFLSLASIILKYIKSTNNENVKYGYVIDSNKNYILKSYFTCNYHINPIVISIANYIKYYYFEKNEFRFVDIFKTCTFSKNDFMIFYGELLYPTYIFNLFQKKFNYSIYEKVIISLPKYYSFVNLIYLYIKKRYIDIPYIVT